MDFDTSSRRLRIAEGLLSGATIAACILTCAILALTMNRGFDFFDDSYYLMAFRDRTPDMMFTATFLYLRPVFDLLSGNIAQFRLFGMILTASCAGLFAVSFIKWARGGLSGPQTMTLRWNPALVITTSSMLVYFSYLRTPGYNMMVGCISFVVLALALPSTENKNNLSTCAKGLLCGVFLGVLLFVKITVFPIILCMCVAMILMSKNMRMTDRIIKNLYLLAGAILWTSFHFMFLEQPGLWWQRESASVRYIQELDQSHSILTVIKYLTDSSYSCLQALIIALPSLIVIVLCIIRRKRTGMFAGISGSVSILVLVLEAASLVYHGYYTHQATSQPLTTGYLSILFIAALTGIAMRIGDKNSKPAARFDLPAICVLCITALFPLATAVGTNNPLFNNALFAIPPLFAVILYVSNWNAQRLGSLTLARAMPCLLSVLILVQIAWGSFAPYGMNSPILRQSKHVSFSPESNELYVDAPTRDFINDLEQAGKTAGMLPGDDLLLFYDYPGIAYVLNAHMPGTPWYFSYSPAAVKNLLVRFPIERLRRSFVITLEDATIPSTGARIPEGASLPLGLDLRRDYQLAARITHRPDQVFELWKPVDSPVMPN